MLSAPKIMIGSIWNTVRIEFSPTVNQVLVPGTLPVMARGGRLHAEHYMIEVGATADVLYSWSPSGPWVAQSSLLVDQIALFTIASSYVTYSTRLMRSQVFNRNQRMAPFLLHEHPEGKFPP